jgi:hypothetical protein
MIRRFDLFEISETHFPDICTSQEIFLLPAERPQPRDIDATGGEGDGPRGYCCTVLPLAYVNMFKVLVASKGHITTINIREERMTTCRILSSGM